jgi:hypothetical protein
MLGHFAAHCLGMSRHELLWDPIGMSVVNGRRVH